MPHNRLAHLLGQEASCLKDLLSVLEQERESLLSGDAGTIEQITIDKNQALASQAEATQARLHLTLQLIGDNSKAGLQQLIDSSPNSAQLDADFLNITALAEQCQELNRSNGRLISQKQQQAQGALDILRQTEDTPATYSGQVTATAQQKGRSLGKA